MHILKISQKISKNPKEKWQEARAGTSQKRIYKLQINVCKCFALQTQTENRLMVAKEEGVREGGLGVRD